MAICESAAPRVRLFFGVHLPGNPLHPGIAIQHHFDASDMSAKCPSKYEEGVAKRPKIVAQTD